MPRNAKKLSKIIHTYLAERYFYTQLNGQPEAFGRSQEEVADMVTASPGSSGHGFGLQQARVTSLNHTRPGLLPWERQ